jgi:hypothetical protein
MVDRVSMASTASKHPRIGRRAQHVQYRGRLPEVPANVRLHPGWFERSLPEFLRAETGPVRFVNVDCDLYSSTKTVLGLLAPRMVTGSVIVFDEFIGYETWRDDEFKAFHEAVERFGWTYEVLCFSFMTRQVALRVVVS